MRFILTLLIVLSTFISAQINPPSKLDSMNSKYRLVPRVFFGIGSFVSESTSEEAISPFINFSLRFRKTESTSQFFALSFFAEAGLAVLYEKSTRESEDAGNTIYFPMYIKLGPEVKIMDGLYLSSALGGFLAFPLDYFYTYLSIQSDYFIKLKKKMNLDFEVGVHLIPNEGYPSYAPYLVIGLSF